ncbi:MAG: hypothetical protein RLZZ316_899 [Bacteroidota bacterium]|jgi:hypothetical protein
MKFDITHHSTAKIAIIVIALYAVIAVVSYFAWK